MGNYPMDTTQGLHNPRVIDFVNRLAHNKQILPSFAHSDNFHRILHKSLSFYSNPSFNISYILCTWSNGLPLMSCALIE